MVTVAVRDNNIEESLRRLKRQVQQEGIPRKVKLCRHFEKPCERRKRKLAESLRRQRKLKRKRDTEGS